MPKPKVPLKLFGGKAYLADKIVGLFPPRDSYTTLIETHCGGCSVTLAHDPEGKSEVVNDLDGYLTNFWRVLADQSLFPEFARTVQAIPFSQPAFDSALKVLRSKPLTDEPSVDLASAFFVAVRQSRAGDRRTFAPLSTSRLRRGMNEQASAWLSAVDGLPEVHARMRRVVILNEAATSLVRSSDKPGVLLYLDPPYPHGTRVSKDAYAHEMTDAQHEGLLEALTGLRHARALISSYPNGMYDSALRGWGRLSFTIDNKVSGKKVKDAETEVIWLNY